MALGLSEVNQPRTAPDQSHLPITAVHTCMDCENERRLLAFCESEEKMPSTRKDEVFFSLFTWCFPCVCLKPATRGLSKCFVFWERPRVGDSSGMLQPKRVNGNSRRRYPLLRLLPGPKSSWHAGRFLSFKDEYCGSWVFKEKGQENRTRTKLGDGIKQLINIMVRVGKIRKKCP